MIFHRKQMLVSILYLLGIFVADARRLKKYHRNESRHNIERLSPLLRQANPVTSSGTGTSDDNAVSSAGTGTPTNIGTGTGTASNVSSNPADALVLINPTKTDSTPRMFKGLLFQALMANRGGQSSVPYIIVNVPNNITNINQNTRPAQPVTTPSTTVTVSTRRPVFNRLIRPQRSQVVHKRGSKNPKREGFYAQNFIRSPNNQLLPVYLPPQVQNLMPSRNVVRRRGVQRRRVQNNKQSLNPFVAFANSLRRIEYL